MYKILLFYYTLDSKFFLTFYFFFFQLLKFEDFLSASLSMFGKCIFDWFHLYGEMYCYRHPLTFLIILNSQNVLKTLFLSSSFSLKHLLILFLRLSFYEFCRIDINSISFLWVSNHVNILSTHHLIKTFSFFKAFFYIFSIFTKKYNQQQ